MKPLNYKERSDKFWSFFIVGTISLALVVFCFYFTNDFLLGGVAGNREQRHNDFLNYQKNQRKYISQLESINRSLPEGGLFQTSNLNLISEFKTSFTKNADTSALMNKIGDLANKDAGLISQLNQAKQELSNVQGELNDCKKQVNAPVKQ